MLQPLLGAYVVVKWIGAFSLLGGAASACLLSVICLFATVGFIGSLLRPLGLTRLIAAIADDGGTGLGPLISPILWTVFFILYPLGLVDWLAALHFLDSNQGYLFSHRTPTLLDDAALLLFLAIFFSSAKRMWKLFKNDD
jgi:hypothetical protein